MFHNKSTKNRSTTENRSTSVCHLSTRINFTMMSLQVTKHKILGKIQFTAILDESSEAKVFRTLRDFRYFLNNISFKKKINGDDLQHFIISTVIIFFTLTYHRKEIVACDAT